MCFRCYQNDAPPTEFMKTVYASVDRDLSPDATGADVVDAVSIAFEKAGPPPGAEVKGNLRAVGVSTLIRTAKRSGVVLNTPQCPPEKARSVLRAVAAGHLEVQRA